MVVGVPLGVMVGVGGGVGASEDDRGWQKPFM